MQHHGVLYQVMMIRAMMAQSIASACFTAGLLSSVCQLALLSLSQACVMMAPLQHVIACLPGRLASWQAAGRLAAATPLFVGVRPLPRAGRMCTISFCTIIHFFILADPMCFSPEVGARCREAVAVVKSYLRSYQQAVSYAVTCPENGRCQHMLQRRTPD